MMEKLLSCAFNMGTGRVELRYSDGSMISIHCTSVEDELANSRFQRPERDWLIYNDPLEYAQMVLDGTLESYLLRVSGTHSLELDDRPDEGLFKSKMGAAV